MEGGDRGPEEIIAIGDPGSRLEAFLVIDSTRLGPAHGGIRVRSYPYARDALLDAMDLAGAMTAKAALAGLACGGGKVVVIDRRGLDRPRAMAAVARLLNDLDGRFFAGPDYGLRAADLERLRRLTRHVVDPGPSGERGLADATARGAMAAIRAALWFAGGRRGGRPPRSLDGVVACVEGLGAVGAAIADQLVRAGAVVLASDPSAPAARRGAALGARIVTRERLATVRADLYVPAAVGGTIDARFAARCRARIVCGPANNVLAGPFIEERLRKRGVLFVPDVLASAGALIAGALRHAGDRRDPGPSIDSIGRRVARVLEDSEREGVPASEIVLRMVRRRLARLPRANAAVRRHPSR